MRVCASAACAKGYFAAIGTLSRASVTARSRRANSRGPKRSYRVLTADASPEEEAEEAEASVFPSRPERDAAETLGLSLVRRVCQPSSCRVAVVRAAGRDVPAWLHASTLKDGGSGGGVALVINLGGEVVIGCPGGGTLCAALALGGVLGPVASGDVGFATLPGRIAAWLARFATRGCDRTGGAATGFPGAAALGLGLTGGCGMTCAFASCCGVRWTI